MGVIVYILLILFAGVLIAEYLTATKDISWTVEIEDLIKKENWEPESEHIPLSDWNFFLYENGEEQYFELKSQTEFISYMNTLMNRINRQIKESISEKFLNEILASNKVLLLQLRFSTHSMGWKADNNFDRNVDYSGAYFVLEDTLEKGLEGTIIAQETNSRNSVWQITKSSLW